MLTDGPELWPHPLQQRPEDLYPGQGLEGMGLYFELHVQFLSPQIDCVADDHQIRNRNEADGSIPCPGEIGVYLFDKINPCGGSVLLTQ